MTHIQPRVFVIGAAVGSLVGTVAALLIAPKTGKKLRQEICNAYCDISNKADALARRGRSMADSIGSQSSHWSGHAKQAFDGARKSLKGLLGREEPEENEGVGKDLLIGGVVGGVVGAALGLLLAPKSGTELRQDLLETCDNLNSSRQAFTKKTKKKANKWLDVAREFVDDLAEGAEDKGEEFIDRAKGLINHRRVHDILDWADLGLKTWQRIKSKR